MFCIFIFLFIKKMIRLLTAGIQLHVPKDGLQADVEIPSTIITGQSDIWSIISFINGYLWFFIGFLCFIFLAYNGVMLVMARGNSKDFDKTKTGMLGSAVGIAICFLSYSLVKLVVNLFGPGTF